MKKSFPTKFGFPAILVAILLGFIAMFVTIVYIDYKKLSANFDTGVLIGLLFFILLLGYPIYYVSAFFMFFFKSAALNNDTLSVFELKKCQSTKVTFSEIEGYSASEVFLGKYGWKSRSVVLYLKSGAIIELVDAFVSELNTLESELKNHGILYLGAEPYKSAGTYTREYQFAKK